MKWYEVEIEMPIFGKNFEIVQAPNVKAAKLIAIRKTEVGYNINSNNILVIKTREINY